jgi:hypothetical protein
VVTGTGVGVAAAVASDEPGAVYAVVFEGYVCVPEQVMTLITLKILRQVYVLRLIFFNLSNRRVLWGLCRYFDLHPTFFMRFIFLYNLHMWCIGYRLICWSIRANTTHIDYK